VTAAPTLRAAVRADAPALAAVLVQTWRGRYRGMVAQHVLDDLDEPGFARWFDGLLAPGSGHAAIVATAGEAVIGFIHVGADEEDPSRGHVFSFYVAPPFSGRGIGRALLARALAELSARGYRVVTLWVFTDNAPAVRLYERAGFRPDGAQRVEREYGVLEQRMRLELERCDAWQGLTG
jgi:ribosomal protein S18 acetylase RimI-like enzyme